MARAVAAADLLAAEGWSIGVINARYARPLDRQLILDQARGKRMLVTFEESVVVGGFGSGVLELVEEARLADPAYRDVAVRILGIPGERFVDHGSVSDLRRVLRLDAEGLAAQVREALATARATPGRSGSGGRRGLTEGGRSGVCRPRVDNEGSNGARRPPSRRNPRLEVDGEAEETRPRTVDAPVSTRGRQRGLSIAFTRRTRRPDRDAPDRGERDRRARRVRGEAGCATIGG